MKLSEITVESLAKADVQELAVLHFRLHQLAGIRLDDRIRSLHLLLVAEMGQRGLEHLSALKSLDGEGEAEPLYDDGLDLLAAAEGLPAQIVWVPDFVSLSGSQLYARGRTPNDADVVLRAEQSPDNRFELRLPVDAGLALKLERVLRDVFGFQGVHYTGAPYGPNWESLPLYSLCLVRNADLRIQEVSANEPEFAAMEYKAAGIAASTKEIQNKGDENGSQGQAETREQEEGQSQETLQEATGETGSGVKAQGRTAASADAEASLANPADYPDESQRLRFVAQAHFRGASAHLDLRFEYKRGGSNYLRGFTVAIQKPGAIKEPVTTLEQARKAVADPDLWKLDLKTGEVKQREIRGGTIRKADLWATPKAAEVPVDWISEEGVTDRAEPGEKPPVGATKNYPGVFLIVQKGTCEWGAIKPWFAEWFLHGDGEWKGRWVFRELGVGEKANSLKGEMVRVIERPEDEEENKGFMQSLLDFDLLPSEGKATADILPPGQASERETQPSMFVLMQPDDQTPYTISPGAIEKGWLPPKGVSCLPVKVRKAVPANLRYWLMSGQAALDARKTLAGIKELGGPELHGGKKAVSDETLLADLLDLGWLEGEVVEDGI